MSVVSGSLAGSAAIVTGGASGIGEELSRQLVALGATVTIGDIDVERGESVAARLGCDFVPTDVRRPTENRRLVESASETFGGLDLVFLNAGTSSRRLAGGDGALPDPAELDIGLYRKLIGANLDGVVFGIGAAIPALEARGGGAIVVTASVAGIVPWSRDPVYTASKHAVVGFVRALAPALDRQRRDRGTC